MHIVLSNSLDFLTFMILCYDIFSCCSPYSFTQVAVFSTLFHRQEAVLRGHYTAIKDISWSGDGLYLVSVSDGEVYTWGVETFSK